MDNVSTMALIAGLGWASGMRLYAVLFFLGILHYAGAAALPQSLQVLSHPAVMAVTGILFITEFFADKVPGFDTLWDALHTFVRIPAGALLAAFAVASDDPGLALAAGLVGGVVTASSHFTKAGARALINTSPEPFTNWTASLGEDVFSLAILWTALKYPLALLVAFALFIVIALWLLPKLWRGIKQLLHAIRRFHALRPGS
jgi:Domain of unknown function (DUF4126)